MTKAKETTPAFAVEDRVKVCDDTHADYNREGAVKSCCSETQTCKVLLDGDTEQKEFRCDQLCCAGS